MADPDGVRRRGGGGIFLFPREGWSTTTVRPEREEEPADLLLQSPGAPAVPPLGEVAARTWKPFLFTK